MEHEKAMKELEIKVLKIMDDLMDIAGEYASWDEWDKSDCVSEARNKLFEKYEDAKIKEYNKTTDL